MSETALSGEYACTGAAAVCVWKSTAELGCPVGTFKAPTSSECEPCPVGEWGEGGYPYPKHCTRCPEGSSTLGKGSYSHDQCGEEQGSRSSSRRGASSIAMCVCFWTRGASSSSSWRRQKKRQLAAASTGVFNTHQQL